MQRDYAFADDMITEAALYGSMMNDLAQDQWRDRAVLFQSKLYDADRSLADLVNEHVRNGEQNNASEAAKVREIACSRDIVLTDAQAKAVQNAISYRGGRI